MPTPYTVGAGNSAAGSSTLVISVSTSTTAADAIFVGFTFNSGTATSCADSQGNVYTLVSTNAAVGSKCAGFLSTAGTGGGTNPTAALTSGTDTITVTYSLTTAALGATVRGCSGVTPGTAADIGTSSLHGGTSGTSAAPSIGPSATLAQASEWALAVLSNGNGGGTPSSWTGGFTALASQHNGVSNYGTVADQVVAATTALTAAATITSTNWSMVMVTVPLSTGTSPTGATAAGTGVPPGPVASVGLNMTIQGV